MPDSPHTEPRPDPDPNRTEVAHARSPLVPPSVWWGTGATRTFLLPGPGGEPAAHAAPVPGGLTIDLWGPAVPHAPLQTPDESPAQPPSGRYLLGSEIGRGGVGAVHEGWDVQLEREIAVKVLLPEHMGKPDVVRRFLEEARITSRLQHPGIVAIHELGVAPDGRPFFVMRLVRGQTLDQILRRRENPSVDLPRLLGVFLQICQAVAYAHNQGVIHRDLKPANVMAGNFGVVKVMDWGLAKVLGESDLPDAVAAARFAAELARNPGSRRGAAIGSDGGTQVGTVFGTPAYLPPEQARGEIAQIDKRADVFGLGGILCEILTGHPPYIGADGHEVYHKAAAADIADAVNRVNACPAAIDLLTLTKWCLSPVPSDRPADAAEVVEVMTAHLQANQRRAEQDLVRFFDLSMDLFCIASTDGHFLRVNENFPRVLGYTAHELTTRPYVEFVHPDDRKRTGEETVRIAGGAPCIQFTNRYRHADGHYVWLEWNAQTVPEERAIYAVARDVTERIAQAEAHRAAERSRAHLAAVVNSADVAIISTSLDGTIQSWNAGAERLFGYRAEEVIGQSVLLLMPPNEGALGVEALNRMAHSERVEHYESVRRRKDGSLVPVSLSVAPVRDAVGNVIGASKIARDISERKRSEAATAERLRVAAFVSATGAALTRGVGLREALRDFVELAVAHMDIAFARVWTLSEPGGLLELQASAGLYTHLNGPDARITIGENEIGLIARERKPYHTNAAARDPRVSNPEWADREGLIAFAGHPLMIGERVVGVMAVFARHELSANVIETLHAVSDSLTLAIRRQQLEDELREARASVTTGG